VVIRNTLNKEVPVSTPIAAVSNKVPPHTMGCKVPYSIYIVVKHNNMRKEGKRKKNRKKERRVEK
jgi:hypothetical protein